MAADDELQREARALGDPTRHRLFRYIVDAPHAVGIAELTEHVRLNHNAVRQHVAILKEAGLVSEEIEPRTRRGRPRLLYRPHPEVAGRWGTVGPYAWLSRLLSAAIRGGKAPRQVGREDGRRRAAELSSAGSSADQLELEMLRRGFRPRRVQGAKQLEFVLGRCPFAEAATTDKEIVCQLHLGIAEGLAEGVGGLEVERLVPKDPGRAECRLVLREGERADESA